VLHRSGQEKRGKVETAGARHGSMQVCLYSMESRRSSKIVTDLSPVTSRVRSDEIDNTVVIVIRQHHHQQ